MDFSQVINQYSFAFFAAALLIGVAVFSLRRPRRARGLVILGIAVLGLIAAWAILHPRQTPLTGDVFQVKQQIGRGTPVLLEFQSPY